MASFSQAAVTPDGIRDGAPAALAALVERRANAVLAYCEAVCPPADAERAAAEAFARFRAAVAAATDPRALDPDALLLGATRHAAASLTPIPRPAAPTGGLRRRLGARTVSNETCALVPDLLAARAEGGLSAADRDRLSKHLERDPACRALAVAVDRAEQAYTSPPARTVPIGALTEIMLALAAAAPITAAPEGDLDFDDLVLEPYEPAAPASDAVAVEPEPVAGEPDPVEAEPEPGIAEPEPVAAEPAGEAPAPEPEHEPTTVPIVVPEPAGVVGPAPPGPFRDAPASAATEEHADATILSAAADEDTDAQVLPAAGAGGGVAHPRPARRTPLHPMGGGGGGEHGVLYRYVLPGVLVAAALLGAMGVAGVFADDPPAPAPTVSTDLAAPPAGAPPVVAPETDVEAEERAALAAERRAARDREAAAARRRERERGRSTPTDAPPAATVPEAEATPAPAARAPRRTTPRRTTPPPASAERDEPADSSSALPEPEAEPAEPPPAASDPGVFEGDAPAPTP